MFESIRKNSKIVMLLLFLLIIPSFVLVGVDSSYFSENSPVVARIDGQDITQAQWDSIHRQDSDRLRAEQPEISAQWLDSDQARYATLERLVREQVLLAAVQKMHLVASDAALANALQAVPAIAALRRDDGSLDTQAYRNLVAAQGMTPEGFEASVRRDLSLGQVLGVLDATTLASSTVAELAMQAMLQNRQIRLAQFQPQDYAQQVQPQEADLAAYYQQHQSRYEQAEQATVQYVVLDMASVRQSIEVDEQDLRTYYQENAASLANSQEERRARHILISTSPEMDEQAQAAAQAQAQALLERVQQAPQDFAAIAKEASQDPGSSSAGGDLGFFTRGAMVSEFEQAAFALEKGAIAEHLVQTDFGYHIIQVTDIKAADIPSFEQLRPRIAEALKDQQAQQLFAQVAEDFSNTVYEQPDSLEPVAQKLGLHIQTATSITREPNSQTPATLANADLLEAIFSSDSLENKRNTDAIETASNQLVAARVLDYQPAKLQALEEVREQVLAAYSAEQAAHLAKQAGQALLQTWQADAAQAEASPLLGASRTISRDQPAELAPAVLEAALQAPTDTLPAWVGVDRGAQGYAIVKVEQVLPPPTQSPEIAELALEQYQQIQAQAETTAYYEWLKEQFKVHIKPAKPL